jgi:hypothetical protein
MAGGNAGHSFFSRRQPLSYSDLSATIGSTLAARRAGIALAMTGASKSDITAATNARGSFDSSRNKNVFAAALRYQAPTPPK